MKVLAVTFVGLMCLGAVFCGVDCSCGTVRHIECVVVDHQYKPAWVETTTHTDADGRVTMDSTTHSEEFHVICRESGVGTIIDCNGRKQAYYSTTNGQEVTVVTRIGKWTGAKWIPRIDQ